MLGEGLDYSAKSWQGLVYFFGFVKYFAFGASLADTFGPCEVDKV
jgi:hypothetical protein